MRYYGPLPAGIWATDHLISSRLFPRSVIQNNNAGVVQAYKNVTSDPNWVVAGLALSVPSNTTSTGPTANAVNPAWRNTLVHTLFYSPWDWDSPLSVMQSREEYLTYKIAPKLEALTPGSATYLNEANFDQLNWQEVFYGVNYNKLYDIKQKYDPQALLYARTAVGSEAWEEEGDGRLCRTY